MQLFVRNLNYNTSEEQLRQLFARIGSVISVSIPVSFGRGRGYGFVTMSDEESANKCIQQLDRTRIDGRNIHVEISKNQNHEQRIAGIFGLSNNNQQMGSLFVNTNMNEFEELLLKIQEQAEYEKTVKTVPVEYNVGGLINLGSYIHLYMINEMDDLTDVQQFIGVNKRTFQLKDHPRFYEVIKNASSELENPDPTGQGVKLERVNGLLRKTVALRNEFLSFSLNKVMRQGIHSVSGKYDKSNLEEQVNGQIGICKADYKIVYPCWPSDGPHYKNMLQYFGFNGDIQFKWNLHGCNAQFNDGQLLTMELNMEVGTLHFFVDGVQQPVFVKGIKEPVKFWFYLQKQDSSFTVTSVKRLSFPTALTLPNSKAFEW
ncbi:MAG: hypothetical protein EZS28_015062 [Streblomastix strix]|uniref:RRM domain-containing protein n=1 Tax=Streblomastix strix TaxID=222440 RepID=A0A5J4W3X4_9EUKA|nr:MAG: hypothetical protein EZS28_015062 [Streblomastix strix]